MPKTKIHSNRIDYQRPKIDHMGSKIESQRSKFEINHVFVPSAKIRHLLTKIPHEKKRQFNIRPTHHPPSTHNKCDGSLHTGKSKKYIVAHGKREYSNELRPCGEGLGNNSTPGQLNLTS